MSIPESTRPITNYPGYRIGIDGSVWSEKNAVAAVWEGEAIEIDAWRTGKAAKKRAAKDKDRTKYTKYLFVRIPNSDGVYKRLFIHVVVLTEFVGPRPNGLIARHLDGNPQNNSLANLAWGTHTENSQDRIRHGTHTYGERSNRPSQDQ